MIFNDEGAVSGAVNVGEEGKGGELGGGGGGGGLSLGREGKEGKEGRCEARKSRDGEAKAERFVDAKSRGMEAVSVTHPCVV